jgi:predicted DNA-binding transcriptional regulator AlpA
MARRTVRNKIVPEVLPLANPHPQLPLAMEFPAILVPPDRRSRQSLAAKVATSRILRMRDVVRLTGVHRSTIHRWIQAGRFPVKDAPRHRPTGWLDTTYERWVRGTEPNPAPK